MLNFYVESTLQNQFGRPYIYLIENLIYLMFNNVLKSAATFVGYNAVLFGIQGRPEIQPYKLLKDRNWLFGSISHLLLLSYPY